MYACPSDDRGPEESSVFKKMLLFYLLYEINNIKW